MGRRPRASGNRTVGRQGPTLGAPLAHYVDRNISDMLRRLDRYTSARARDLRDSGDIGSFAHNLRRIVRASGNAMSPAAAIAKASGGF